MPRVGAADQRVCSRSRPFTSGFRSDGLPVTTTYDAASSAQPVRSIHALIPHRGPMLLIDAVVVASDDSIECAARVRNDNPFLRHGSMRPSVCLEYMAQTVAAFAGLCANEPGPAQIGYLIGANRVVLRAETLKLGDQLNVHARRRWGDVSLGQFECSVVRDGAVIAEAVISVYRPRAAAAVPP